MAETYEAPDGSREALDNIPSLISRGKIIQQGFTGKKFLCKLPRGQLFFESALQLDTDGSALAKQDASGQSKTSARYSDGRSMNADTDIFFVLPDGFYAPYGISIGDIGVVIYKGRKVFACFGDVGPKGKLGEGSIALHRALGHETVVGGRLRNVGLPGEVMTIVFPGSGNTKARTNEECRQIGERLLSALFKQADSQQWSQLAQLRTREIDISSNRMNVEFQLFEWMQEVIANTPHPEGSASWSAAYLVRNATGIEMVMAAPTSMYIAKPGEQSRNRKTVYADFRITWNANGRWYVSQVHFHVPMTAAEKNAATRRVLEERR